MSIERSRNYNSGLVEVDADFNEHGSLRLRQIVYKGDTVNGESAGIYFDIEEVISHLEKIKEVIDDEGQAISDFNKKGQNR